MTSEMHAAAPHYLPGFITAPGNPDSLMIAAVCLLIFAVMALGSLYFWLHSLPERLAHGAGKLQFQLVGVMSLLALFTHNNAFWVGALFLALVPIPDFRTPFANIADALGRMAERLPRLAPIVPAASTGTVAFPPGAELSPGVGVPRPAPISEGTGDAPDIDRIGERTQAGA